VAYWLWVADLTQAGSITPIKIRKIYMAHQFTIKTTIEGVSIDEFKRLTHDISLHEAVCHRLPA
jgi:hypothetical protein